MCQLIRHERDSDVCQSWFRHDEHRGNGIQSRSVPVKGCQSLLSDPKATTRPLLKSTTTESVCPDAARYETACTPSAIFIVAYCFSSRDAPLPGPSITRHISVPFSRNVCSNFMPATGGSTNIQRMVIPRSEST